MKTFLSIVLIIFVFSGCWKQKLTHIDSKNYIKEINLKNNNVKIKHIRYKQAQQWSRETNNQIEETIIED